MPIPAMFSPLMSMAEMASAITEACDDHISWGLCSTHPGWGKYWGNSRWAIERISPLRSKTIARELLVPWSNDKMYCSISFGFMIVAESLSGGSRQTSDYKSTKKISFRIKTAKFFFRNSTKKSGTVVCRSG